MYAARCDLRNDCRQCVPLSCRPAKAKKSARILTEAPCATELRRRLRAIDLAGISS
jgi:hypothetical protein